MKTIREHWASRLGFVLASIGSTIGLGLLWKLPYTIGQNGGGLFLLTYFVCIFLIGMPVFVAEVILGKKSQTGVMRAFGEVAKRDHFLAFGGICGVLSSFLIMSFYSVIAGWGLSYLFMALSGSFTLLSEKELFDSYEKLASSGSITLFWHFLFTTITMLIVMSGVRDGIEYWSKQMVRILFVLLVLLFGVSLTLPGFAASFSFIFSPDLSSFKWSSAAEALGLAFLTLSLGQGIMVSYGSYLPPKEPVMKMAFIVAASVMGVAILASFIIFPVVFTFGLPPSYGPGLVFKTLPMLFTKLPGTTLLSILFFTLFVFTALTSAVALIEVVAANLMERMALPRKKAVIMVSIGTFLFGLPSVFSYTNGFFPTWHAIVGKSFMDTVSDFSILWLIPLSGLAISLFVGWVMGKEELRMELERDSCSIVARFFSFMIRYGAPLLIMVIIFKQLLG